MIDPGKNQIKCPIEIVRNMLISMMLFEILNNSRIYRSLLHAYLLPFCYQAHILQLHCEIYNDVFECNCHKIAREVFIKYFHFH